MATTLSYEEAAELWTRAGEPRTDEWAATWQAVADELAELASTLRKRYGERGAAGIVARRRIAVRCATECWCG
jgi:hypothetical protein